MEKILSIIIPVYNVEQYLEKCLESVLEIKHKEEIEVLVINDGSTDGSLSIIERYKSLYPSVMTVVDKENGGHGSAWNVGLKLASGKYLKFLDSDDWLSNLDEIIILLKRVDVDIVFSNLNIYYSEKNETKLVKIPMPDNKILDADTFEWDTIHFGSDLTNFHYCIYRRAMLQPLYPLFLEKTSFDDGILFVAPLIYCKTIYYNDMVVYNYLIGRQGQSMGKDGNRFKKIRQIYNVRIDTLDFCLKHKTCSVTKNKKLARIQYSLVSNLFTLINRMPYNECKQKSKILYDKYNVLPHKFKKRYYIRMYEILPFCFYWGILHFMKKWFK